MPPDLALWLAAPTEVLMRSKALVATVLQSPFESFREDDLTK